MESKLQFHKYSVEGDGNLLDLSLALVRVVVETAFSNGKKHTYTHIGMKVKRWSHQAGCRDEAVSE